MSASAIRDKIFGAGSLPREKVHVPEWDVDLWVKVMTVGERDQFDAWTEKDEGMPLVLKALVMTVQDESGNPVWPRDDIERMKSLDIHPVLALAEVALRLNKLRKKDAEELEKNFGSGPTSSSASR